MKNVCFICVYFGEIPKFFKTFLDSCTWNTDFDWLIIHDKPLIYDKPQNVHDIIMNLEELQRLIENKTGIKIPQVKPYKICDFRPAFGVIFEEYLQDYEFWGICDTDLILGKLSNFITKEMLDSYDKIFTMGHMSLVRNNSTCNELFKKSTKNSRCYKEIFLNPDNCIYDEYEGFTEKFCDSGLKVYKEKHCADISKVCGRFRVNERWLIRCIQPKNNYTEFSKDKNYKRQIFWINNGRTFRSYIDPQKKIVNEEYSYIHKLDFACDKKINASDSYIITTHGYVQDDELISALIDKKVNFEFFDKYNKSFVFKEAINDLHWFLRWNYRHFKAHIIRN